MRLFPSPLEGLHPALPPWPKDVNSPAPANSSEPVRPFHAAYFGLVPLVLGVALKLPYARAFALESAAYGALALAAGRAYNYDHDLRVKRMVLEADGIAVPNFKIVDRVGKLDSHDISLLGAAIGITLASVAQKPWSIAGWKRYLGAAVFGSAAANRSAPWVLALLSKQEDRAEVTRWEQQKLAGEIAFRKFLISSAEQRLQNSGVEIPSFGGSVGFQIKRAVPVEFTSDTTREKYGHLLHSWPNEGNAPHLVTVQTVHGRPELEPYAHTNYTWTSSDQLADLRSHIARLAGRRQQFAEEAQSLWTLLAEDEAKFYNTPAADTESKLAARKVVEALGDLHTKMWIAVSHCDWMLEDAKKRISQLKSAESDPEHRIVWKPQDANEGSRADLLLASRILDAFEAEVKQRTEMLKATRNHMQQELKKLPPQKGNDAADRKPPFLLGGVVGRSQTQGPDRAFLEGAVKELNGMLEAAKFDGDTLRKVRTRLKGGESGSHLKAVD